MASAVSMRTFQNANLPLAYCDQLDGAVNSKIVIIIIILIIIITIIVIFNT